MPVVDDIRGLLNTREFGRELCWLDTVGSTNDTLKSRANELGHGSTVIAALQTAGRGRLDRSWLAPHGSSLLMSVMLKPRSIDFMSAIPLLCGLAAAKALNRLYGEGFGIKWPNDIVCEGKKVCGILCEARIARPRAVLICGFGVNLTQDRGFFERSGLPFGASVCMLRGGEPNIAQMAATLLSELETAYDAFAGGGIETLLGDYRGLCVTLGRQVDAVYKEETVTGTAVEIAPDGSLVVETERGRVAIGSGEVLVRGIMGHHV